MSGGLAQNAWAWLVLLLAFGAANFPFLTVRLFGLLRLPAGSKSLAWRMLELVLLYFVVGAAALLLEARQGQMAVQGWEFYVVTGAFFLVLAFPGFCWRYLAKHRGADTGPTAF